MIFIRGARQLVTLRGRGPRRVLSLSNLEIIADGSVLIRGGTIVEVGATRRIENLREAKNARVIEAGGKVVMPGFVDCHTRPAFAAPLLRDFEARSVGAYNAEQDPEPRALDQALDLHGLSNSVISTRARRWLRAIAASGTTTVDARCGYGLNLRLDLKVLRAIKSQNEHPIEVTRTYVVSKGATDSTERDARELTAEAVENIRKVCFEHKLATAFELEHGRADLSIDSAVDALGRGWRDGVSLRVLTNRSRHSDTDLLGEADTVAVLMPGYVFHRADSIEPGKQADIAIFDVGDYREIPYYFGINLCVLTMKKGVVIYPALPSPPPKRPPVMGRSPHRGNVRV